MGFPWWLMTGNLINEELIIRVSGDDGTAWLDGNLADEYYDKIMELTAR